MKTTPIYGWPYPEAPDHTRTWEHWQSLATSVENTFNAPTTSWTPTLTGITLGNGTVTGKALRIGNLVHAIVTIRAAAASPTTVWQSGSASASLPNPLAENAMGNCIFTGGSPWRTGIAIGLAAGTGIEIDAIRQSDLGVVSPGTGWGTAVWAASGYLVATITYPTTPR